jgi:hypothetical protein
MKTVRFVSVSLILVAVLSACPAATPDPPKASSITVAGPTSNTLKLNEATTFTAIAKDSSGAVITGKTLVWTSSDEKIATVDSSGKVTAKHFGTVKITASVDSITGSSATQTTYGLEVRGGTTRGVEGPAVILRFRKADGSKPPSGTIVTLTGPTDWNSNTPLKVTRFGGGNTDWFQSNWFVDGLTNLNGTYQASVPVGGQTFTSSFTVDTTQKLTVPSVPIASNISANSVTVTWSGVTGVAAYSVDIWNKTDGQGVSNSARLVIGTTVTIENIALVVGKTYYVQYHGLNTNPDSSISLETPLPDQFNTTFAFGADFTL